jgi:hypothetical protein
VLVVALIHRLLFEASAVFIDVRMGSREYVLAGTNFIFVRRRKDSVDGFERLEKVHDGEIQETLGRRHDGSSP